MLKVLASAVCAAVVLSSGAAHAEGYFGVYAGAATSSYSGVSIQDAAFPAGGTVSDFKLKTVPMFGAKLGGYFPQVPWLGFELEGWAHNPDVKPQTVTVTSGGVSASVASSGDKSRVWTAAVNILVRYPGEVVQPYAGLGMAVVNAKIGDQDDYAPGLNALVGVRFKVAEHFTVFVEGKHTRTSLDFAGDATNLGVSGKYQSTGGVFGAAVTF